MRADKKVALTAVKRVDMMVDSKVLCLADYLAALKVVSTAV